MTFVGFCTKETCFFFSQGEGDLLVWTSPQHIPSVMLFFFHIFYLQKITASALKILHLAISQFQ